MKKIIDASEIDALQRFDDEGDYGVSIHYDGDFVKLSHIRALLDKAPTLQDAMLSIIVESAIKMLGNVEISDIKAPSVSGEAHYEGINAETTGRRCCR